MQLSKQDSVKWNPEHKDLVFIFDQSEVQISQSRVVYWLRLIAKTCNYSVFYVIYSEDSHYDTFCSTSAWIARYLAFHNLYSTRWYMPITDTQWFVLAVCLKPTFGNCDLNRCSNESRLNSHRNVVKVTQCWRPVSADLAPRNVTWYACHLTLIILFKSNK